MNTAWIARQIQRPISKIVIRSKSKSENFYRIRNFKFYYIHRDIRIGIFSDLKILSPLTGPKDVEILGSLHELILDFWLIVRNSDSWLKPRFHENLICGNVSSFLLFYCFSFCALGNHWGFIFLILNVTLEPKLSLYLLKNLVSDTKNKDKEIHNYKTSTFFTPPKIWNW